MNARDTDTQHGQLAVGRRSLQGMRMPPLNLLRTFEAAAWHGSFTLAADELHMTQSAVSQQIRQLEEALGQRLFDRLPRRLKLTSEGTLFANSVREALTMIGRACQRLKDPKAPSSVKLEIFPSLGIKWLGRRLSQFTDAHPEVKLTVISSREETNLDRSGLDLSIRWGNGGWPDGPCENLGTQPIVPVCSPRYLQEKGPIETFSDILQCRLLQTLDRNHWPAWMEAAGLQPPQDDQGPYFSDTAMMLEACLDGQGICLATFLLLEEDLSANRLVCPVDLAITTGEGFYIVSRTVESERPAAELFRGWLAQVAAQSLGKVDRFCPNIVDLS